MTIKRLLPIIVTVGVTGLFVVGIQAGPAWADDEQTLQQKAAAMDQAPSTSKQDDARAHALAKEFKVPESTVTDLRNKKMGWGEITISLAMARYLAQTSKTPMTTEQALTKIEQMRSEKMGWGKIAKESDFKLGPVVSEVKRSERAMQSADRTAAERQEHASSDSDRADKPDRMEKTDRPDRPDKPERPEHPDRPVRPGR